MQLTDCKLPKLSGSRAKKYENNLSPLFYDGFHRSTRARASDSFDSSICRTRSDVSGHCPDLSGTTKDELGVVNDPRF